MWGRHFAGTLTKKTSAKALSLPDVWKGPTNYAGIPDQQPRNGTSGLIVLRYSELAILLGRLSKAMINGKSKKGEQKAPIMTINEILTILQQVPEHRRDPPPCVFDYDTDEYHSISGSRLSRHQYLHFRYRYLSGSLPLTDHHYDRLRPGYCS